LLQQNESKRDIIGSDGAEATEYNGITEWHKGEKREKRRIFRREEVGIGEKD
jgi:hypothetical protein